MSMRVYELAKETGHTSKELLALLKKNGSSAKAPLSNLEESEVSFLRKKLGTEKNKQQKKTKDSQEKTINNQVDKKDNKKTNSNDKNINSSKKVDLSKKNGIEKKEEGQSSSKTSQKNPKEQVRQTEVNKKTGVHSSRFSQNKPKDRGRKFKKKYSNQVKDPVQKTSAAPLELKEVDVFWPITVSKLAETLAVKPTDIIQKLMQKKVFASINQRVEPQFAEDISKSYGVKLTTSPESSSKEDSGLKSLLPEIEDKAEDMSSRAPIVTFMGHVDHGKTSLLDALRKTQITSSESGGITQHIGAYEVITNHGRVTFIDTPGHEAFTAMRSRGAQVTDVVVLVVAADDGVKPQTIEAINHAKFSKVPILIAVNKCDKPDADPQKVRTQLTEYELVSEEWGGQHIFVDVSAETGDGLDQLVEMLILEAEMLELKANAKRSAHGVVLEAHLDKKRGALSSFIIKSGTLKVGDIVVAGSFFGKVRTLINDRGQKIDEAGPSVPVEVSGLAGVPFSGDLFSVVKTEKEARWIQEKMLEKGSKKEVTAAPKGLTLEDLYSQIKQGNIKEFNIVLKSDKVGSLEALKDSLVKLSTDQVELKILHQGVGAINESDVVLAKASRAVIIGFHVDVDAKTKLLADDSGVDVRIYYIIYEVIENIQKAMEGVLEAKEVRKDTGQVEVRALFKSSKIGTIAGCYVTSGQVQRGAFVSIVRDGKVIGESQIQTLRREKDDAKHVKEGYECGIVLDKFKGVQEKDVFDVYIMEKVKQTLN
ncbi:hypothetical protein AB834_05160 [PVC group bacterium (ex Bugula neritina AB1)]|nr:hypothetical protein AB834_05160 [PVC group bacterium (ex Bugula neritina AB1)]